MRLRCGHLQVKYFPWVTDWAQEFAKGGEYVWAANTTASDIEKHGLTLYWTHDSWRAVKLHKWVGWTKVGTLKHGGDYAMVLIKNPARDL